MNLGVTQDPLRRRLQLALTLAGMSGMVLPFVPFTYGFKPFTDVFLDFAATDTVWLLAVPCILLPVPVCAGYLLWLVTRRLAQWTIVSGYALAALFVLISLAGWTIDGWQDTELILMILLYVAAFASGAWLNIRGISEDLPIRGLVAMQSVYVMQMIFWITYAWTEEDFQIGAWLGVITVVAYLAQIALAVKRFRWLLAIAVPLASIILHMVWTEQYW